MSRFTRKIDEVMMFRMAAGPSARKLPCNGRNQLQGSQEAKTGSAELPDGVLVGVLARAERGEESALRALFMETSGAVFRECLSVCKDRASAETILVEIYVEIWRGEIVWRHSSESIVTTMSRIARARAKQWCRDDAPSPTPSHDQTSRLSDAVVGTAAKASGLSSLPKSDLSLILAKFESPQRDAIRSAFLSRTTYAELAEAYHVDTDTMKDWVRLGIAEVKKNWDRSDLKATNDRLSDTAEAAARLKTDKT